jgi:peptide/nickel transport system substrate-binding protein
MISRGKYLPAIVIALIVGACSSSSVTPSPTASGSLTPAASGSPTPAASGSPTPGVETSCSNSSSATSSELRITREGPIYSVFLPVRASDNTYPLMFLVFSNLVKVGPDETTILPDLATNWTVSQDGTTFEFTLADNVKWQDGTPFTADDVVYTANWAARYPGAYTGRPQSWTLIKGADATAKTGVALAGITAVDARTIRIVLDQPDVFFLRAMADAPNAIMPEHLLKNETDKTIEKSAFAAHPVGTGPYTFVSYQPDQYVEFAANNDYFKGAPKICRVFFKILTINQILAQVESGDVDVALKINAQYHDQLAAISAITVQETVDVGMNALFVRTDNPALSDKRVRQAMYYAIDRQSIITSILRGAGVALWNPPGLNFQDLNQYAFDPAKARSLLAAAGYNSSQTLRLVYWKDAANASAVLPVVQQELGDVGIKVQLVPLEVNDWDSMVTDPARRGEWDLDFEFGGTYGLGPDYSSASYKCKGPKVQTGYQNCALQALFDQARGMTDQTQRDQTYHQAAAIINDAADAIYLWSAKVLHPVSNRLSGVQISPFERETFMGIPNWTIAPAP